MGLQAELNGASSMRIAHKTAKLFTCLCSSTQLRQSIVTIGNLNVLRTAPDNAQCSMTLLFVHQNLEAAVSSQCNHKFNY